MNLKGLIGSPRQQVGAIQQWLKEKDIMIVRKLYLMVTSAEGQAKIMLEAMQSFVRV